MRHTRRFAALLIILIAGVALGQMATTAPTTQSASQPAAAVAKAAVPPVEVAPPPAAPKDPVCAFIDSTKHPTPWLTWGADFRFRNEYNNNTTTFNKDAPLHETDFFRYRTRLGSTITPVKDFEINSRLVWEFRDYTYPNALSHQPVDVNDALFDTLNFKLKNIGGSGLTATIGRQDIKFGDGWLVLDGTPLDGSRTLYFDALRFTYEMKDIQTVADFVWIDQHGRQDFYIEPFNYDHNPVRPPTEEENAQGAILYVTNKSIQSTEISGYFIYKNDYDRLTPNGETGEIYAFGGRGVHSFDKHWTATAEGVLEAGNKAQRGVGSQELIAGGFNSKLNYAFNDRLKNNARTGFEFRSGRNPNSGTNNEFDPLWGRWPQFSELLSSNAAFENGKPAFLTNFYRLFWGHAFFPLPKLESCLDYHLLFADENTYGQSRPDSFTKDGKFRGQLLTWLLRYQHNEHLSSHFLTEFFAPGNYYTAFRNDPALYLRYELMLTW